MDDVTTEIKSSTRAEIAKDGERESGIGPDARATERLRARLNDLHAAPVPDMRAIDEVMEELDETHAASKAKTRTDDPQRY